MDEEPASGEQAYRLGKTYEQSYRGCGQCVVAAVQDTFGVQDDAVFRAATGFAAGGGLCGDGNCGAYAGGIMVLSYLAGRPRDDFDDRAGATFASYGLVQALREHFIQEYGSVKCRDIQYRIFGRPFFLLDEDDARKFDEAGGHLDKCPEVVGKAARWTAELIAQKGLARGWTE
ncbi:MAG: C-GCAxxG-C-C family protein [Actinomycetia bacterium]|nr:C-GCAxxG-C-C family protein [Actinomycetes bacterium]